MQNGRFGAQMSAVLLIEQYHMNIFYSLKLYRKVGRFIVDLDQ